MATRKSNKKATSLVTTDNMTSFISTVESAQAVGQVERQPVDWEVVNANAATHEHTTMVLPVVENEDELKFLGLVKYTADLLNTVDATIQTNAVVSDVKKADIGRAIWAEEIAKGGVPVRGHTIKRLMIEAGLTKNGAATYYQNMKKKAGLVNSKVVEVAA